MKKTILITGASSGIGKATAKKLIGEGHKVYVAARRIEQMKDLEEMGATSIRMDIIKDEDIKTAVDKITSEQGKIDVLINNAGYAIYGSVEDTTIEDAKRQFEVNLFGLARLTQLVLPQMRKQKSGTIINTSSMGGKIYTPLGAWYHASKHALEGWSDCLRIELKQFGINVVIIEPGIIRTEFDEVMAEPMVERSKGGPYEAFAGIVAKATEETYQLKNSSPASVVAEVMSKAVNSDKPKTRYTAGKMAKTMMWARKYLGDRIFDKLIFRHLK